MAATAEGVVHRRKAERGEKTMVNAWAPASVAQGAACDAAAVLTAAAKAAHAGAVATKEMLATKGRVARLSNRTCGQMDPGAASKAIILKAKAGGARRPFGLHTAAADCLRKGRPLLPSRLSPRQSASHKHEGRRPVRRRDFLMSTVAIGAVAVAWKPGAFAQDQLTILGSVPSLSFPFFVHMLNQIKAEAEAQGVNLNESDGQNSAPKQTADVEAAVVQGVAAIVISPLDVNALAPAVEGAVQAGIPVVTIDRRVDGVDGILAHVGADNVKGGEAEAQAMVDAFPDGATLFHLQGQPGAGPAIDRNRGVHNVLDPLGEKYKIVFEQTANFARAEALTVTEAGLAANGKPDAIICANDDMALGAAEACAARGFNDVKIYGFDALPEALVAVKEGRLAGTVEQFPGEQSRTAVRIAVAFARDGKEPEEKLVLLTPVVINKDNLDKAERIGETQ